MTIKEIAKLAGVSISTVSKIVNNKDQNINSETRNRVLKIVKEYNYTPYGMVKNISTAKTFLLGVLLNNYCNSGNMLDGILSAAQERGYSILLLDSKNSSEDELKHITTLCRNKIDGLLWEPVSAQSFKYIHYFSEASIPIVYLNAPETVISCSIDYQKLGYCCAKHLLQWRHTRIGCLMKKNDFRSQKVYQGVKECLFDHHISQFDGMSLDLSEPDFISRLASLGITGIISSYFDETLKLYQKFHALRYQIPADYSLITLCNDNLRDICFPAVSSIQIPYGELGYQACQQLIAFCEKKIEHTDSIFLDHGNFIHKDATLQLPPALRAGKFLVLGSVNADVTLTVDDLPETGKSTLITDSSSCAGGKGTNQSVGAARLGHEAILLGKVGSDADAGLIFDILNQNQLPADGILKVADSPTGKAYIYIQKDGEVSISYIPGANSRLNAEDIRFQKKLMESCEFCLISTDIPIEAATEAAVMAKELSIRTILKPSALNALPDIIYQTTDIFVPNEQEAAAFCPQFSTIEEQANYFYNRGIPVVIITLGHSGCYVRTQHLQKYFPAANFEVVDTTGGADAFICALAVHLSDGYPLEKAIPIAQYAAGFCISQQGVTSALVTKDTLHSYIRIQAPKLLEL